MKYLYYVVYNYYKYNSSGSGSLGHERRDKLDGLEKIIKIQSDVFEKLRQEDSSITGVIITNFILLDEVGE